MQNARRSALDADALKKPRLQAAASESLQTHGAGATAADLKHKRSMSTRTAAGSELDFATGATGFSLSWSFV